MKDYLSLGNKTDLTVLSGTPRNYTSDLLSAIPLAIAAPILSYQRTKAQKEIIIKQIESNRAERVEIMRTMRELARLGQLTPEVTQQLLVAYYQQPY